MHIKHRAPVAAMVEQDWLAKRIARAHIFVDGRCDKQHSPFASWQDSRRQRQEVIDMLHRDTQKQDAKATRAVMPVFCQQLVLIDTVSQDATIPRLLRCTAERLHVAIGFDQVIEAELTRAPMIFAGDVHSDLPTPVYRRRHSRSR